MKRFLNEFKTFAMRGNVIDLAVGVVIGGAFGKITTSIVNDIIMPFISMLTGGLNFSDWKWVLKEAVTTVGADGSVTAYLRMATSFSVDVDSTSGTSTSGITLGDLSTGDSATLCALTKDMPKQISVLVYLDGDIVDNSMVANGLESMSGKLNLQFSSSATLTPMQYTPLTLPQEDAGSDTTTNGAAAATTTVAP